MSVGGCGRWAGHCRAARGTATQTTRPHLGGRAALEKSHVQEKAGNIAWKQCELGDRCLLDRLKVRAGRGACGTELEERGAAPTFAARASKTPQTPPPLPTTYSL